SPPVEWEINETVVDLKMPYQKNAKTIKIFHDDKEIFSFNISSFCQINYKCDEYENEISCPEDCSTTINETTTLNTSASGCGNSVCDSTETYFSCPQDCHSGGRDGYCDSMKDGICDPDCMPSQDSDCASSSTPAKTDASTRILIVAIFGVIMLFIILFIIIRIKSGSEK
ncbi:MAG: hypothetical protein NTZ02_00750, partial [Candidatus Woesearchaeota archaeon]|nr:hypothetical protein [Candidatus Woesearchaeota archaeon]